MRLEEPSEALGRLKEPCGAQWCPLVLTSREGEPSPLVDAPFQKSTGLDNTVGPVPKISGCVFNTLQTNPAAHVPNTNTNLINEDTHFCDLNLYQTIFQNVCLIDSLSARAPDTSNHGVAHSNTITSGEVFLPVTHSENEPKTYNFTQY